MRCNGVALTVALEAARAQLGSEPVGQLLPVSEAPAISAARADDILAVRLLVPTRCDPVVPFQPKPVSRMLAGPGPRGELPEPSIGNLMVPCTVALLLDASIQLIVAPAEGDRYRIFA